MFRCLGIYGYWIDWINLMFLCNQTGHNFRSSRPEVFLRKGVLKICSKFTGEHPCRSAISIKLQNRFIEITLWHGWSPVNLWHIFKTPFPKNTSGWLLLEILIQCFMSLFVSVF